MIFGADWATKCSALSPLFAKLSVSGKLDERRKWGRVDLAQVSHECVFFFLFILPFGTLLRLERI